VQGNWSLIATGGTALGQVWSPSALAVDPIGNLYVAEWYPNPRIQQRGAQGNWFVIATVSEPGQVHAPTVLAVDAAGNLYVAGEVDYGEGIEKRDAQGNWSVIAKYGTAPGQVIEPTALAADSQGNLYVAEGKEDFVFSRIQRRDARGNWSLIATAGDGLGQVDFPTALAADTAGNLYVADRGTGLRKRDAQGNWSWIDYDQPTGLAVDTSGNLYVADAYNLDSDIYTHGMIQKRNAQGNWSVIANDGWDLGQVRIPSALVVDNADNVYVAEQRKPHVYGGTEGISRIQKRDAQGNWLVITEAGSDLGQVGRPTALAVDAAGNLYVADSGNDRVLKYTPQT
jgi:tripartite motif-containing protein 71